MSHPLQQALEELYGLERRKDKLGLEGTRALLGALGNPERSFRSIHVAGTNGKGSVCAMVERVLREAGYRTGLFTSPHLVDFRERIRVNGRWADEAWLERALARIQALPEGKDRTFFEVVTALGFLYFAEQKVEWAIVEVGLGGRLDTTNVLTPEVCAITSIGLDHTEILGDTIEQIAAEKAGILKPGVPIVLGERMRAEAIRKIHEIARSRAALVFPNDVIVEEAGERKTKERSDHDPHFLRELEDALRAETTAERELQAVGPVDLGEDNGFTARGVLKVLEARGLRLSEAAIRTGIARARWPGRLERCPTDSRLWWDGAHNVQALERLSDLFQSPLGEKLILVLALGRDKDARAILDVVRVRIRPHLTIVTRTHSERALEIDSLRQLAEGAGLAVETSADVRSAVERGLALVGNGKVLLTGSLFAVGEAMEAFGGAPGEQL